MSESKSLITRFKRNSDLNERAEKVLGELKSNAIRISEMLQEGTDFSARDIECLTTVLGCVSIQIISIESAIVLNDVQTIASNDVLKNAQELIKEISKSLFA